MGNSLGSLCSSCSGGNPTWKERDQPRQCDRCFKLYFSTRSSYLQHSPHPHCSSYEAPDSPTSSSQGSNSPPRNFQSKCCESDAISKPSHSNAQPQQHSQSQPINHNRPPIHRGRPPLPPNRGRPPLPPKKK
ncbi:hypothetical protein VNO77_15864 [Canavalia gladiata]|uniref:Uncharacterized protein n=1 Tax=Canavalia gladiata TaxID=3824 RepID=A0AAN9M0P4_CANGL